MARTNKPKGIGLSDEEIAQALADEAAERAESEPETPVEPEPPIDTEPTIADRFVQMNALIVNQRQATRLSEATLAKMMELAFQYHAWNLQWEAQQAQRQPAFDPRSLMGIGEDDEGLVGPTGEYLGATETTEEETTDGN